MIKPYHVINWIVDGIDMNCTVSEDPIFVKIDRSKPNELIVDLGDLTNGDKSKYKITIESVY